jgi:transcriptional regulator with XRE-family HTH domain
MENEFGNKIKKLREENGLLQREVASLLDIDNPLLSKIERGERKVKREQVFRFAQVYKVDPEALLTDWLVDQIFELLENETVAYKAIQIIVEKVKKNNHGKAV